jgi:phosphoglycerate dehydrogenase-like enzyme
MLSPHVRGVTRETVLRIAPAAVRNAAGHLTGRPPGDVVS